LDELQGFNVGNVPFKFQPLPLLRLFENEPQQVCRFTAGGGQHGSEATLVVRREGAEWTFPLHLATAAEVHEILLPEVAAPCQAQIELRIGETSRSVEVPFTPVRRWDVYLVNHSHTDIGFTHTPNDVERIHTKNLAQALALVEATADWPEEARYRWTCESAWQVQNFLRTLPDDRDRLVQAIREGTIEVEALYIHSYFDLLNREQLVRSLYFAQELREDLAVPVTSAMISDVPGAPWSLVDVLARSGVRHLSMAPNNFLAPFHEITDLTRPFVWEGQAGGRVIVWYTDDPYWAYIEGARHGFWTELAEVEQKLPLKLAALKDDQFHSVRDKVVTNSNRVNVTSGQPLKRKAEVV
jgi:Glycosyl hydrolases family 38 N-terminal domain